MNMSEEFIILLRYAVISEHILRPLIISAIAPEARRAVLRKLFAVRLANSFIDMSHCMSYNYWSG